MKKILYILLLLVCINTNQLYSQITLTASDTSVCDENGTLTVNFTLTAGEPLSAISFGILWDSDQVINPVLQDISLGANSYNTMNIANGVIGVNWFFLGQEGKVFDNEQLFTLTLQNAPNTDLINIVNIEGTPAFPMIFGDTSGTAIDPSEITIEPATITFGDTEAPVFLNCPTDITQTASAGQTHTSVSWADIQPSDNCNLSGLVITSSHNSSDNFPIGTTQVTITGTDAAGLETTCTFDVTVEEETPTTVVDDLIITIENGNAGCESYYDTINFVVDNFTNMTAYQFGVTWDETVLEYIEVINVFSAFNNFNTDYIDNGEVKVQWFNGGGETLTDGSILFSFVFNYISQGNATSSIQIQSLDNYDIYFQSFPAYNYTTDEYVLNSGTLTGQENLPPTITDCHENMTFGNTEGECGAQISFVQPIAQDDCLNPIAINQTSALGAIDYYPIGTHTVSYEAIDNANQIATCSFTITVNDTEMPTFETCPDSIVVNAPASACESPTIWSAITATDNCGDDTNLTITSTHNSGDTFPTGETLVTYTATDAAGNAETCTFKIIVADDESPNFGSTCPSDIVQAADIDDCATTVTWIEPTPTDNCTTLEVTASHTSGAIFPIGTVQVTYTATDSYGNIGQCSFNITVTDDTPPVIVCPDDIVATATDSCSTVVMWAEPTPSDNCSIAMFEQSHESGDTFEAGETLVTYTVADSAESTTTCTFSVTVNVESTISITPCPADITMTTDLDSCSASVTWFPPVAQSSCGGELTILSNYNPGDDFPVGLTTVTYNISDIAGTMVSCFFTVEVTDEQAPVFIDCPVDTTIIVAADSTQAHDVMWTTPMVMDNCTDAVTLIFSNIEMGSSLILGDTTVTYTATDTNGNEAICSFVITVTVDTTHVCDLAFLTCPSNAEVTTDAGICGAMVTYDAPTYDTLCAYTLDSPMFMSGDTLPLGNTIVEYSLTDGIDTVNCNFMITVNDEEIPTFMDCPVDTIIMIAADSTQAHDVMWTTPTAIDNCTDTVTLTSNIEMGSSLMIGDTTVTYTATDANGNEATCSFMIMVKQEATVMDTCNLAFLTCPENITVAAGDNMCGAMVAWDTPTYSPSCDYILLNPIVGSGDEFAVGSTTVTYGLTDGENTIECGFLITVTDDQNPVIATCPDDFVMETNINQCTANISWATPVFQDNCGITEVLNNLEPNQSYAVGTHNVLYTATDAAGNTAECSFSFEVKDEQAPQILGLQPTIVAYTDAGECGATVTWNDPILFDNCQVSVSTSSHNSGDIFPVGTTTVTYTVFDNSQNFTQYAFAISVIDDEAPQFDCVESITVNAVGEIISDPDGIITDIQSAGCNQVELNFTTPQATDACTSVLVVQTEGEYENGDVFPAGSYTLEYTATDSHNNSSVCYFDVIVQGEAAPNVSSTFEGGLCEGTSGKICVEFVEQATYSWFDANGNQVGSQQCLQLNDVTMADAGIYTVSIVTATNCIYTATYELVVNQAPVLQVSVNDLLCTTGNENLEFQATDLANTNVTSWEWSGQNVNSSVQNLVVGNATADHAGSYELTAINENGCIAQITTVANVTEPAPTPVITALDQTLCLGATTIISANNLIGETGVFIWSATPNDGAGLPTSTNSPQLQVSPTQADNYTYTLVFYQNGCTSAVSSISIDVEAAPEVNILQTGNLTCVDGTTELGLTENGGEATNWSWTNPSGQIISTESSLQLSNATAAQSGLYTVTAMTDNGCTTTQNQMVSITEQPAAVEGAFVDATLCNTEDAIFQVSNAMPGQYIYQITGNGAPIPTSQTTINFGTLPEGNNSFSIVALQGGCTSASAEFSVEVQGISELSITQDGTTECVPNDAQVTLTAEGTADIYEWRKQNNPNTVLGTGASLLLENINAQTSGTYEVTVVTPFGCTTTASTQLEVTQGVNPVSIVLSNQGCLGESIQLQAEGDNSGVDYRWLHNGTVFSNDFNPTINYLTVADTGAYQLMVLNPTTGCSDTSEVEYVRILDKPVANPDIGYIFLPTTHIEMELTDNDELVPDVDYTITIFQQPEYGGVEIIDASKGKIDYIRETERAVTDRFFYEVCYDDCDRACERAMVTIDLIYDLDECVATNLISPNGDGTNDEFILYCLDSGSFPDNELTIYNQWGDKVYHAAPYTNDWKGTFEGENLPDGTYFYVFKRDNESTAKKGYLTIFR